MRMPDWFTAWFTARRVDLLLGVAVTVAAATGLASWAVGSGWARWVTVVHALAGLSVVALAPAKVRGSVRVGLKRRRITRWLSVLLGGLVAATVVLGVLHATGLWHGVGYWSALWTHVLLAALLAPLVVWHIASRPGRPRVTDLDRRTLAGAGAVAAAAAATYGIQQLAVGDNRRFTGSHEIASFHPSQMPTTMWLNDRTPRVPARHGQLPVRGGPAGRAGGPALAGRTGAGRPRLHRRLVEPPVVGRGAAGDAAAVARRAHAGSHFADRLQPAAPGPRRYQPVPGRRLRG